MRGRWSPKKMYTLCHGLASQSLAKATSSCRGPGLEVDARRSGKTAESPSGSHGILPEMKPSAQAGQGVVAIITADRHRHQISPGVCPVVCPGGPAITFSLFRGGGQCSRITLPLLNTGHIMGAACIRFQVTSQGTESPLEKSWHSGKINLF